MFVNFGSLPIQSGYFDATLYVGVMKLPADCSYRKLLTGYIARTTWCFLLAPNPTFNSHRTLGMYVRDDDIKLSTTRNRFVVIEGARSIITDEIQTDS